LSGKFFNYKLCLHAFPAPDWKSRIQYIVSHAMDRAGSNSTMEDSQVREYMLSHPNITDFRGDDRQKALIRGAILCGVEVRGTVGHCITQASEANTFVRKHEERYGTDALVCVASELLWACHNDEDPPWREFSTLAAINSIVGFKTIPVLIRRTMIAARQLGYKTPAVMEAELKRMAKDKKERPYAAPEVPKPLTTQRLRDTLDQLEDRNLIRRCQASRTCVYFSTTMSVEDLRAAVKKKVEGWNRVESRREIDRALIGENQARTKQEPLKKRIGQNA
jgi:hypothetical protein